MDTTDSFPPIPKLESQNRCRVINNCYYEETKVVYDFHENGQVHKIDIREWVQKPCPPEWCVNNSKTQ